MVGMNDIGNYARHAQYWDWSGRSRDEEHEYWLHYAKKYGPSVLSPMCAWGETGAYMARHGCDVTAFDITPEMIAQGRKRFGDIPGLQLYEADVRDFHFDIPPADFCFSMDFGHILTLEDVKRAFACINRHLRTGGCLVIKAGPPPKKSYSWPLETYQPLKQVYPNIKVWKTGEGRDDAKTGRHYITQTFYAQDETGHTESFDHAFYMQSYTRGEWLEAFAECGFDVVGVYKNRERKPSRGSRDFHVFEAVKK